MDTRFPSPESLPWRCMAGHNTLRLLQPPNLQSGATSSQFVLLDSRKMCKRLAIRGQVLHPHIDHNYHGVLTRSGLTKATWDRATLRGSSFQPVGRDHWKTFISDGLRNPQVQIYFCCYFISNCPAEIPRFLRAAALREHSTPISRWENPLCFYLHGSNRQASSIKNGR